jgi:uncharacterized membrane protein
MELVVVIVLTMVMIPSVIFTAGALQIVLGVAFLLFFPGYALVAALFPRRDSLDPVERIALSLVLSIAVVPMMCLVLNYTTWGMSTHLIVGAISGGVLACSLAALLRRRRLPKEERFEPRIRLNLTRLGSVGRLDQVFLIVLCLATLGAVGTLAYVIAVPRHVERFSEFYVLGANGMMQDYPQEVAVGQPVVGVLGIVNREDGDTTYSVEITIDGESVHRIGPIQLSNNERWEDEVSVVPSEAGLDQEVAFLLYRNDDPEPYLILHVVLNVKEEA